jgi:hypothetical protein
MNGNVRFQLVEKLAAHAAPLRRVGAVDAVGELRHSQRGDHDGHVAGGFADYLGRGELLPLGRDQHAGIEN